MEFMSIQAGLVGLPNVGKSTLFNALTKSSIPAENYPFCTIDPHVAITNVPDPRLEKLSKIYGSQKLLPASVTFVDIAGLVKGAAAGQGLGNQFLSHIREVDCILHVLRCFEDPNIIHTDNKVDPLADYEIIMSELMLKDLESLEKRIPKVERDVKINQNKPKEFKESTDELVLLKQLMQTLNNGDADGARALVKNAIIPTIPLLSTKNFLVIANIAEAEIENDGYVDNPHYQAVLKRFGKDLVIPVSAKVEYELSLLSDDEAQEMMAMLGLKEKSLDSIIRQTYKELGLITFFTCGPKEAHAWPLRKGTTVRKAAGEIHSDLERGFICADVFNCRDLFELGSEVAIKDKGRMRREGQDYIVQDGDLLNIKFNV
jgi:GTP-binding protein YchF